MVSARNFSWLPSLNSREFHSHEALLTAAPVRYHSCDQASFTTGRRIAKITSNRYPSAIYPKVHMVYLAILRWCDSKSSNLTYGASSECLFILRSIGSIFGTLRWSDSKSSNLTYLFHVCACVGFPYCCIHCNWSCIDNLMYWMLLEAC